ncbi:hypothetical protein Q5O24_12605 [Eubacteriaceae bacterium ES3]|nr:hypothetical protein Q5O24_12605 [Eubacteriaceae bacterium ES3]
MRKVKRLKMRGIPRRAFIEYFNNRAREKNKENYYGEFWEATVFPEYFETTGSIKMNCVEVELSVEADRFEAFLFQFRKDFLRGGG